LSRDIKLSIPDLGEEELQNVTKVLEFFNFLNLDHDGEFISDISQLINTEKKIINKSIPKHLKQKVDIELSQLMEIYKN